MTTARQLAPPRTAAQSRAFRAGRRAHREHFAAHGMHIPGEAAVLAVLTPAEDAARNATATQAWWAWFERGWRAGTSGPP